MNSIANTLVGILLVAIYGDIFSEARPTPSAYGDGVRRQESLALLEISLRQVLNEISCQQLDDEQLVAKFNSSAAVEVRSLLKHIELPSRDGGIVKLYFLDYRRTGSHSDCVRTALPRLRLIRSVVPVFPPYYMDWECKSGCVGSASLIENYDLLRKTGNCDADGNAEWVDIDGSVEYPLNVDKICSSPTGK